MSRTNLSCQDEVIHQQKHQKNRQVYPCIVNAIKFVVLTARQSIIQTSITNITNFSTIVNDNLFCNHYKKAFRFSKNNIKVTIPFDRLAEENNAPVKGENVPVDVPVNAPVERENVPVKAIDTISDEEKILMFCEKPRGILEICAHLKYKDKRSVRKRLQPLLE